MTGGEARRSTHQQAAPAKQFQDTAAMLEVEGSRDGIVATGYRTHEVPPEHQIRAFFATQCSSNFQRKCIALAPQLVRCAGTTE
jgi:hypothetical protein